MFFVPQPTIISTGVGGSARGASGAVEGPAVPSLGAPHLAFFSRFGSPEAGKILGIKQPHVSALMRNRSGTFSVERLMDFLSALGQDVEITVRPTSKPHGEVSVVA